MIKNFIGWRVLQSERIRLFSWRRSPRETAKKNRKKYRYSKNGTPRPWREK